MNDPSPTFHGRTQSEPAKMAEAPPAHSMRSRRTATWARPRDSEDGYSRYIHCFLLVYIQQNYFFNFFLVKSSKPYLLIIFSHLF